VIRTAPARLMARRAVGLKRRVMRLVVPGLSVKLAWARGLAAEACARVAVAVAVPEQVSGRVT
jgi:hypothetical protein